ncbi:MAG: flavodoxin family protein [Desulforhopalus sp.]
MKNGRILIVYYSFTQQSRVLLKKFVAGLEGEGVEVALERLEPSHPFEFPFRSNYRLISAMISTFFCRRMEIKQISEKCFSEWDSVVLAGPTWSYHPSGPVLDFLDRFGHKVCSNKLVIPFISCRSYWRIHHWGLKRLLLKCGAKVAEPIVFVHPMKEPWRFIGLVMQLRGKMVRKGDSSWFRKHYPGYGHNKAQGEEAFNKGIEIAKMIQQNL